MKQSNTTKNKAITVASTIALALGTAAVVAPTPTSGAQEATGENLAYTGDIVARSDQQQSEALDENSCVMNLTNVKEDKNQAGFTFSFKNPSADSLNKTEYGFQMHFDTSKQRTFTYAYFTDSGLVPVPEGEMNPIPVGEKLIKDNPFTVNDTATPGEITASRSQRNLNSEFTFSEQFQQKAISDEGLTLAWRGDYSAPDPKVKFFAGSFATGARVNPWPNESENCQPLNIHWEDVSKAVVKPGKKVKIATAQGMTESDLSRLRIKVEDGNGEMINNAMITREGSDFFLTWPTFVDDKTLDSQQNLKFTAVAMPRTIEQLSTITNTGENEFGEKIKGNVTESSIALPRYNTANELSSHSISTDDTLYHDPKYTTRNNVIVSKVNVDDSGDTPQYEQTEDSQKTVFHVDTNNGPSIQSLIDDYNATVKLIDDYVYDGWEAKFVDPENGNYDVEVTTPPNAVPGTFAQPLVEITYSNGSKDVIPLLANVIYNNTQTTEADYPVTSVPAAATTGATVKPNLKRVAGKKGEPPRVPVKYELDKSSFDPEMWDVTLDEETGNITAKPTDKAPLDAVANVKVTATYEDTTTDEATATFRIAADIKVPEYNAEVDVEGANLTLTPTIPEKGLSGSELDTPPTAYSFAGGALTTTVGAWTLTIDPQTGVITTTVPEQANGMVPNTIEDVKVIATYEDKTQTVTAHFGGLIQAKRPIPYKVEYTYDDQLPAGTYNVTTPGKAGLETQNKEGNWSVKTDPVNEVVAIGTKPAEANKDATFTHPLQYPTIVRPNPDLAPGEFRIVTPGVNGEVTYTAKFNAVGDKAEVIEETNKKDPVTEIIEYGPAKDEEVTIDKTPIPNKTRIIEDNTLERGQTVVEVEGKPGLITKTTTQKLENGKPSGDPVITEEKVDPVDTVIRVGSKPKPEDPIHKSVDSKITEPIEPNIKYEIDPELEAGTTKEKTPGVPGEKEITITHNPDGSVSTTDKVIKEAEPKIVLIGTKQKPDAPLPREVITTVEVEVSPDVEYREDPNVPAGETKVENPGTPGKKEITVTHLPNGEVKQTEREITPPVNKVVLIGTKQAEDAPLPRDVVSEVEVETPPNIRYEVNPELAAGATNVKTQGTPGKKVVKVTHTPDGQEVREENVVSEPTETVIEIGTKQPKDAELPRDVEASVDVDIAPDVEYVYDDTLEVGQVVEDNPGTPGKKRVTVTTHPDGSTSTNGEHLADPVNKVIRVGTKPTPESPLVRDVSTKVTQPIDPNVTYEFDPNLPSGETKTKSEGEPGEKEITVTITPSGETVTSERIVKEAKPKVVVIGTKPADIAPLKLPETLPFSTVLRPNKNLAPGETREIQAGKNGSRNRNISVSDGKLIVNVTDEEKPVDRIVEYGPRGADDQIVHTDKKVLPFETKIIVDDTLDAGQTVVEKQGVHGKETTETTYRVVDGKISGEGVTKTVEHVDPVDAVIRVGSKRIGCWTCGDTKVTETVTVTPEHPADPTDPTKPAEPTDGPTTKPSEPTTPPTKPSDPTVQPEKPGSSEKAKQCAANAFKTNSPLLYLLPLGLLAGAGLGINHFFGPQIQQVGDQINGQVNAFIRDNFPDRNRGNGGHGLPDRRPEWMKQAHYNIQSQIDGINAQFAPVANKLQPVGVVLGALAAIGLTATLIAQACTPEGFDDGMTILHSSKK